MFTTPLAPKNSSSSLANSKRNNRYTNSKGSLHESNSIPRSFPEFRIANRLLISDLYLPANKANGISINKRGITIPFKPAAKLLPKPQNKRKLVSAQNTRGTTPIQETKRAFSVQKKK
jgi:hypothetical protein